MYWFFLPLWLAFFNVSDEQLIKRVNLVFFFCLHPFVKLKRKICLTRFVSPFLLGSYSYVHLESLVVGCYAKCLKQVFHLKGIFFFFFWLGNTKVFLIFFFSIILRIGTLLNVPWKHADNQNLWFLSVGNMQYRGEIFTVQK